MDEVDLYYQYSKNSLLAMDYMHDHVRPKDLAGGEFHALYVLGRHGPVPMTVIARAMDTRFSGMTRIADSLVSRGLAVREQSRDDRRIQILALTRVGTSMFQSILDMQHRIHAYCTMDLSDDEVSVLEGFNKGIETVLARDYEAFYTGASALFWDPPDDRESPGYRLFLFERNLINGIVMRRIIASMAKSKGISKVEYGLLEAVYMLGERPIGDLADRLLVLRSDMTYTLDKLVSRGFVERKASADNRRVVMVGLTGSGWDMAEVLVSERDRLVRSFLSDLTYDHKVSMSAIVIKLRKRIDTLDTLG